jgi:hypothetical protein
MMMKKKKKSTMTGSSSSANKARYVFSIVLYVITVAYYDDYGCVCLEGRTLELMPLANTALR